MLFENSKIKIYKEKVSDGRRYFVVYYKITNRSRRLFVLNNNVIVGYYTPSGSVLISMSSFKKTFPEGETIAKFIENECFS